MWTLLGPAYFFLSFVYIYFLKKGGDGEGEGLVGWEAIVITNHIKNNDLVGLGKGI
jgi:hypothetical protein